MGALHKDTHQKALSIKTLSIKTLSIKTFSIKTLCIAILGLTLFYTQFIMQSVVVLNVVAPNSHKSVLSQTEETKLKGLAQFYAGNTKGGSIIVPLTSCLTGLDQSLLSIKTKNFSCHTADSKPVKQEVNGTMILPLLVFPVLCIEINKWIVVIKKVFF